MQASRRTYNILVVEDNSGDVNLLREAFNECDCACNLEFVDSNSDAMQLLRQQKFDLVLSDMGIPNGETGEFIRAIRSDPRLKLVPIIVFSGSPDPRVAYEAGANAFIAKTMDMDQFFFKIETLMRFWTEVAELPPRLAEFEMEA